METHIETKLEQYLELLDEIKAKVVLQRKKGSRRA
jgi:hypothetical protein